MIANLQLCLPGSSVGSRRQIMSPMDGAIDGASTRSCAASRSNSDCKRLDGKGVRELFPSIADSSMVRSEDATTSIRIILRGARSVGTKTQPTAPGMPSYGRQLDDNKVAAVLNYMRNSWGGAAMPIASEQVSKVRRDTALRPD